VRTLTGTERVVRNLPRDGREALRARPSDNPQALGGWELVDEGRLGGHRNFTVRSYDPASAEMVIDVAEHAHGLAIDWLRAARPGAQVLMAGARSWYSPPAAGHHVLAGDLAALPALARILAETGPAVAVTVIAEVLDRSEPDYLPVRSGGRCATRHCRCCRSSPARPRCWR
jgi:NADPH-dependent ferric siderophore reductase